MAEEVLIFAAASLKTALDQVAKDFTAATGHDVLISYAASNTLANQILAGAPADLYFPAAEDWMDEVEKAGLIAPDGRKDVLGNQLVLVAHDPTVPPFPADSFNEFPNLLDDTPLAMAMYNSVPAGQYGKAALENLGLWAALEDRVVQTENVRMVLRLVDSGEAKFGIVYASDAVADEGVHVVATFPDASHPTIIYPVALLTTAADAADRLFYEALSSEASNATFLAQGFSLRP